MSDADEDGECQPPSPVSGGTQQGDCPTEDEQFGDERCRRWCARRGSSEKAPADDCHDCCKPTSDEPAPAATNEMVDGIPDREPGTQLCQEGQGEEGPPHRYHASLKYAAICGRAR